jgi:hypothetical protein
VKNNNSLRVYFWVIGVLVVLIAGVVGVNAMIKNRVNQKPIQQKKAEVAMPTTVVVTPTPDLVFRGEVTAPVSKQMLKPVYTDTGPAMSHLILNLVPGTDIKAGISGEVVGSSAGPKGLGVGIQIRGDKGLVVSYLYTGTLAVKTGQKVTAGEVIGQIREGTAPSCLGTGDLGMYISDANSGLSFSLSQLK